MKIGIEAGKYDILHQGHLDAIIKGAKLVDFLILVTHGDDIVTKVSEKKCCFVPLYYRKMLLRGVLLDQHINGEVMVGIDEDGAMVKTLAFLKDMYPQDELIYMKGGDRVPSNMLKSEKEICEVLGINIRYNVGELLNSSTKIFKAMNSGK